jgi:hypothetical protein
MSPNRNNSRQVAAYIAGGLILAAVTGAVLWYIRGGWQSMQDEDFGHGMLVFALAVGALAIALAIVSLLVIGGRSDADGISLGNRMLTLLASYGPMQIIVGVIGFSAVGLIGWFTVTGTDSFSQADRARGLITFAVAIVTVAIAMILVSFLIFGEKENFKERFTFGKDVLMVFVGILGTIMGFYYGSGKVTPDEVKTIQQSGDGPAGAANVLETQGFQLVLKKDVDGAIKVFELASKSTPASPNVNNVTDVINLLKTKTNSLEEVKADPDKLAKIWKDIYCDIANNHRTAGQAKDLIDNFTAACTQMAEKSPSPTTTPAPAKTPLPNDRTTPTQ